MNTIQIQEGMVIRCDTLTWIDPYWEFGHPSVMLYPVIRCFENLSYHESIVESVMINGVVLGKLLDEDFEATWAWRGYKLPVLRRRFKESLAGKHFPKANYHAERSFVHIIKDSHGELTFEYCKDPETLSQEQ